MVAKMTGSIISAAISGLPDLNYRCGAAFSDTNSISFRVKTKTEAEKVGYRLDDEKLHYPITLEINQQ